jgi:hypothetical protein
VHRLLPSELSGPDLAAQLFISLNTLRAHTKSIYAKLGAPVRRLFAPSRRRRNNRSHWPTSRPGGAPRCPATGPRSRTSAARGGRSRRTNRAFG